MAYLPSYLQIFRHWPGLELQVKDGATLMGEAGPRVETGTLWVHLKVEWQAEERAVGMVAEEEEMEQVMQEAMLEATAVT